MPYASALFAKLIPLLLLAAVSGLAGGCAAPARVAYDEGEDFSRFRTWGWRPNVTATLAEPTGRSSPLNLLLARKIARELTGRGYAQSEVSPDLVVRYGLTLERRTILAQVPRAPYLLSSLSSSASYWVEGTDLEKQRVDDVTISIDIADPEGRTIWTAESRKRLQRGEKLDLDAIIVGLLAQLPERRVAPEVP